MVRQKCSGIRRSYLAAVARPVHEFIIEFFMN
ncbi:Uncharacterised protein [Klebsiella pneumoniae]|nr:Uncharacterised protein [Klebsiella pneumoniae]